MTKLNVDVIHYDKDITVANVQVAVGYHVIVGHGVAKRDPKDHPNRLIGEELAVARALGSAATRLRRQVTGHVKHLDDVHNMVHRPKPTTTSKRG